MMNTFIVSGERVLTRSLRGHLLQLASENLLLDAISRNYVGSKNLLRKGSKDVSRHLLQHESCMQITSPCFPPNVPTKFEW